MNFEVSSNSAQILIVEDNPADERLILEALRESKTQSHTHVVKDGEQALAFLHRRGQYGDAPRPDVVLLDLNLPKKDGREVLAEIKADKNLKNIPIVILSTSEAEKDVSYAYLHHANCYVVKFPDLDQFFNGVESVARFWLNTVKLPPDSHS